MSVCIDAPATPVRYNVPVVTDEQLAVEAVRDWCGAGATITPLRAMNSSAWLVRTGALRHVLKVSSPTDEAGLGVAAWLEDHGLRTGGPLRMDLRHGRLVALLRFVEGRSLGASDEDVAVLGAVLGRFHSRLAGAPVPTGLERWPWRWLDVTAIAEPDLREAAEHAIQVAERLAPTLTHGPLHGDPAPEAFLVSGDTIALIDWGAACHGPLLYDVASARMYAGDGVLDGYARTAPIGLPELAAVDDFVAFRWAVQAWYFSERLCRRDLTGLDDDTGNEVGLADARRALLGPPN